MIAKQHMFELQKHYSQIEPYTTPKILKVILFLTTHPNIE